MNTTDLPDNASSASQPHLASLIAKVYELQAYPIKTSATDLPRWLSRLSHIRVIGPLGVLIGEVAALLAYLWRVRRPWLQQVTFNAQIVSTLKIIHWHLIKQKPKATQNLVEGVPDEFYQLQLDADDRLYAFQLTLEAQARTLQTYEARLQENRTYIQELQAENARLFVRMKGAEAAIAAQGEKLDDLFHPNNSLSNDSVQKKPG